MDRHRTGTTSRRAALRRTTALVGMGTTIFWLAGAAARAQAGKLAKEAVKYVDQGDAPGRDCDDCRHYIAAANAHEPATCRIVEGAINPHGHCLAFTPKATSAT